jgi:hypothetical protein
MLDAIGRDGKSLFLLDSHSSSMNSGGSEMKKNPRQKIAKLNSEAELMARQSVPRARLISGHVQVCEKNYHV